jgi:phage terminase small subunit
VMREYARIAFADVRNIFGSDGNLKQISELDDDTAAVIQGIDVVSVGNAMVGEGQVLKIKMADKIRALDMLSKHLGIDGKADDGGESKDRQITINIVDAKKPE